MHKHQTGKAEVPSSILTESNILLLNILFSNSKASHVNNANIANFVRSSKYNIIEVAVCLSWSLQWNLLVGPNEQQYFLPTRLREGNVFSHVCPSVSHSVDGGPM